MSREPFLLPHQPKEMLDLNIDTAYPLYSGYVGSICSFLEVLNSLVFYWQKIR